MALIIFFTALNQPPGSFRLYNLVGQNYNEVLDNPAYDQVELEISSTEPSDEYDEGIIISQEPRANTSVRQGSVVRVVVSSGLRMYTVPDVAGKTQEQARAGTDQCWLCFLRWVQQSDDTVPAGQVISTSPAGNEEAKKGSTVTIYLSTGSRNLSTLTTVPRVVRYDPFFRRNRSCATLTCPLPLLRWTAPVPPEKLSVKTMKKGARVAEGTTITLEVSSGNAPQQTVNCSVNVGDTSPVRQPGLHRQRLGGRFPVQAALPSIPPIPPAQVMMSADGAVPPPLPSPSVDRFSPGFTVNFQSGSVSNTSLNTDLLEEAEESSQGSSGTGSHTSSRYWLQHQLHHLGDGRIIQYHTVKAGGIGMIPSVVA